jgi:cellulose synthase/poly-beta-1,6-N-acetylglucosamine synthase-like glycosyltransferase
MIFYIISIILILNGLIILFLIWIKNKDWHYKYTLTPKKVNKYAVLIPARNESKVIVNLLNCLKEEKALDNTYVIVESKSDPTWEIVQKYHAKLFLRTDLENKHRKGYALDECLKDILKKEDYDLYFIFDADNTIEPGYINKMINCYEKGYDIVESYRDIKNSENIITTCSGLIFSLINTLINETRNKLNKQIIISGTGYVIDGKLIQKWQGFPFNSLTEDYELSLYATANNLKTYYYKDTKFYDEQPTTLKMSITQRTRWVKGFFEARAKRLKDIKNDYSKIIGVTPYILILSGLFLAIITSIINLIIKIVNNGYYYHYLNLLLICLLVIYFSLMTLTIAMLIKDNNKINLNKSQKIKAIFYNPIFLLSFITCLFKSFGKVNWETIKHGK